MATATRSSSSKAKTTAKKTPSNVRPAGTPSRSTVAAKAPTTAKPSISKSNPPKAGSGFNVTGKTYDKATYTKNKDGTVTLKVEKVPYGTAPGFFDVPGNNRSAGGGGSSGKSMSISFPAAAAKAAVRPQSTAAAVSTMKGKTGAETQRAMAQKKAEPRERFFELPSGINVGITSDPKTGVITRTKYGQDILEKELFKKGEEIKAPSITAPELEPVDAAAPDLQKSAEEYQKQLNEMFKPIEDSEKDQLKMNDKFLKQNLKAINSATNAQIAALENALGLSEQRSTADIENTRNQASLAQKNLAFTERGRARALKGRLADMGALGTTGSGELSVAVLGEQYDIAAQSIDDKATAAVNDINLNLEKFRNEVEQNIALTNVQKEQLILQAQQKANEIANTVMNGANARKSNLALQAFTMAKADLDAFKLDEKERKKQEKEMLMTLIEKGAVVPKELQEKVFGKGSTQVQLAEISRSADMRNKIAQGVSSIYDYIRTNFGVAGNPQKQKEMVDTLTNEVISGKITPEEALQRAWSTVSTNPEVSKRLGQISEEAALDLAIKKKQLATMGRSGTGAKPVDPSLVVSYANKLANGEFTVAQIPNEYLGAVSLYMDSAGMRVPPDMPKPNLVQPNPIAGTPGGFVTYDEKTGGTGFIPIDYSNTPGAAPAPAPAGGGYSLPGGSSGGGGFLDSLKGILGL